MDDKIINLIVIDDSEDALRISDEMRSFLKANFNLKLEVSSKDQENTIQLLMLGTLRIDI